MIDITQIVIAIIGAIALVVTGTLVPKLKVWLNSKTTKEQQGIIYAIVKTAVSAAQQLFETEKAIEKKEYAIKVVTEELERLNITIDTDTISLYIEGVLKDIKTASGKEW